MQRLDLAAHADAQLGVEVGERLVEQEHLGIAHDGAAHGDALALAAREFGRAGAARYSVRFRIRRRGLHPLLDQLLVGALRTRSENAMFSATVICG